MTSILTLLSCSIGIWLGIPTLLNIPTNVSASNTRSLSMLSNIVTSGLIIVHGGGGGGSLVFDRVQVCRWNFVNPSYSCIKQSVYFEHLSKHQSSKKKK